MDPPTTADVCRELLAVAGRLRRLAAALEGGAAALPFAEEGVEGLLVTQAAAIAACSAAEGPNPSGPALYSAGAVDESSPLVPAAFAGGSSESPAGIWDDLF